MTNIQKAAALLGAKGGRAGTGTAKTRNPEHYRAASIKAWAKRRLTVEQRFWLKVNKEGPVPEHAPALGPCWVWTASIFAHGYGQFNIDRIPKHAHRVSWQIHHGSLDDSKKILHRCDNKICVRPSHLFEGTLQDNVDDMHFKGRARKARGELAGKAKLTEADVRTIRKEFKEGLALQSQLAERFSVAACQISGIVNRRYWRHVS